MAKDEPKKDKPKSKAAGLYDHPTSRKLRGEESHNAEAKTKPELAKPEAKKPAADKPADKKPEAGDDKPAEKKAPSHHERHASERDAMHKSHETERRDLHGNHREQHRQMHERHQKAHKDLMGRHEAEMVGAGAEGVAMPGEQPPAGTATQMAAPQVPALPDATPAAA